MVVREHVGLVRDTVRRGRYERKETSREGGEWLGSGSGLDFGPFWAGLVREEPYKVVAHTCGVRLV